MSLPLNTDNWSGSIKRKPMANTDDWNGLVNDKENRNPNPLTEQEIGARDKERIEKFNKRREQSKKNAKKRKLVSFVLLVGVLYLATRK